MSLVHLIWALPFLVIIIVLLVSHFCVLCPKKVRKIVESKDLKFMGGVPIKGHMHFRYCIGDYVFCMHISNDGNYPRKVEISYTGCWYCRNSIAIIASGDNNLVANNNYKFSGLREPIEIDQEVICAIWQKVFNKTIAIQQAV